MGGRILFISAGTKGQKEGTYTTIPTHDTKEREGEGAESCLQNFFPSL